MHDSWNALLNNHVVAINHGHSTEVDYSAIKPKQLAFLINAYNAFTVELILTKYPDLKSIKDLGNFFSSPWSKEFVPLLDKTRSLDDI